MLDIVNARKVRQRVSHAQYPLWTNVRPLGKSESEQVRSNRANIQAFAKVAQLREKLCRKVDGRHGISKTGQRNRMHAEPSTKIERVRAV